MVQSTHPVLYWLMILAAFYFIVSWMTNRWGGG